MPDHLGVRDGVSRRPLPGVQQRVDDGVELFLGRIPRLEQVVVEVDDVDGVDRGVGVGVSGQQHPSRRRVQVHRLLEEFDTGHLRHPVVGDERCDRLTTQFELLEGFQRIRARLRPYDPVGLAVVATQVPGDGPGYRGIVVDGQASPVCGSGDRHLRDWSSALSMRLSGRRPRGQVGRFRFRRQRFWPAGISGYRGATVRHRAGSRVPSPRNFLSPAHVVTPANAAPIRA